MNAITTKFCTIARRINVLERPAAIITQHRWSSFKSSQFACDIENVNVKYDVTSNPEEWKYVERVLPLKTVPKPTLKEEYPSDWKPPSEAALNHPYFVNRTKNHMLPVFMATSFRGMRRLTYIKKIQGDIWLLEKDIKVFLQEQNSKPIRMQVNEFAGYICVHGDHVNAIKYWLMKKNF